MKRKGIFARRHAGMTGGIDVASGSGETNKSLAIQGRINVSSSDEMRTTLAEALNAKPASLSIDLSGVSYIDTSGVATLIEAARIARQQGTQLLLKGMHDQPLYFFDITHLGQLFEIAPQEASK